MVRRLLLLLAAVAVAGCTGAATGADAETTGDVRPADAGREDDNTTPTPDDDGGASQADGAAVGEIVAVLNVESFMNGEPALSGDLIAPDAELSTDATGLVRFMFSTAGAECVLIRSSSVVVVSEGRRLLRQVSGETACEVDSSDGVLEFVSMGRVVRMERGLVRLTATSDGGGSEVLRGRAQAVDPDTGDAVTMGPGDRTGWDTSGALDSAAEPSPATSDVDAAVSALTAEAGTGDVDGSGAIDGSVEDDASGGQSGDGVGSGSGDGSGDAGSGEGEESGGGDGSGAGESGEGEESGGGDGSGVGGSGEGEESGDDDASTSGGGAEMVESGGGDGSAQAGGDGSAQAGPDLDTDDDAAAE